ncbi:MAG: hypothetical protein AB7Q42_01770 [Acidimicrobiia bacterium]
MGQPVAVVEKPSSTPGVVRYEANRSLSGQGHDRFVSLGEAVGPTPSAEVARRLFGSGKVAAVHVFSNIITVDLLKGHTADGLGDIIRDLYQYWRPGMAPPAFEDVVPAEEAAPAASAGESGGGGGEAAALSEAAKRVPAHLLERSRLAREKWKSANAG